jgi:thiol-disulfide isomerase/thioredoxin
MLSKKICDVPVYLWLLLVALVVYLLYNKVFMSEGMENANKTADKPADKPAESNSNETKVYNFNTSWCGYSVRFQEEWNKFANEIAKKNDIMSVKVYDIKCDNASNESMCRDYEVPGFPTVIMEKNGKRETYEGPRTADSLLEAVKQV